mmetsp:Transcript_22834/g.38635  ORF Transcript_22834/g.38635 Transcript_22834/m.38635 type:complete len:200 (+) Transcript_22834:1111-1710(+)
MRTTRRRRCVLWKKSYSDWVIACWPCWKLGTPWTAKIILATRSFTRWLSVPTALPLKICWWLSKDGVVGPLANFLSCSKLSRSLMTVAGHVSTWHWRSAYPHCQIHPTCRLMLWRSNAMLVSEIKFMRICLKARLRSSRLTSTPPSRESCSLLAASAGSAVLIGAFLWRTAERFCEITTRSMGPPSFCRHCRIHHVWWW